MPKHKISQDSSLTQMSIADVYETVLADALMITDEVSILLQQNGINPSNVNRLFLPAGYTRVGLFTILTLLPETTDWLDDDNLWAFVGPLKWKLSRHYQIHRIFPNRISGEFGVNRTLAVVSYSDFRYDINLGSSGTTAMKGANPDVYGDGPFNSYKKDWRVLRVFGEEEDEIDEEEEGLSAFEAGGLDDPWLNLHQVDEDAFPALHNDKWTMWDVDTGLSRAARADMAIRQVGAVALPYPLVRNDIETLLPPGFARMEGIAEDDYMTIGYMGWGWEIAKEHFKKLGSLYMDGQIRYSWIAPVDQSNTLEIEDDMVAGDNNVPMPEPPTSEEDDDFWTGTEADGLTGIPESISVQFPAKSSKLNKILLYIFTNITHGRPNIDPMGGGQPYVEPITITDHIKSHAEFDVEADPPEDEAEILAEDGITEGYYDFSTGVPQEGLPKGLTEDRVYQLLTRAARLSRMYYSRFYA